MARNIISRSLLLINGTGWDGRGRKMGRAKVSNGAVGTGRDGKFLLLTLGKKNSIDKGIYVCTYIGVGTIFRPKSSRGTPMLDSARPIFRPKSYRAVPNKLKSDENHKIRMLLDC